MPGFPRYKAGVLSTQLRCSIIPCYVDLLYDFIAHMTYTGVFHTIKATCETDVLYLQQEQVLRISITILNEQVIQ